MQKNLRFDLVKALHKKMKFSIKDFYSKWNKIRSYCGFGQIYWRNPEWKILFKSPWYGENTLTYKLNKQIYRNIFLT